MKYNKEYIQDLLDKFMEGQTTDNEEQILSEFFDTAKDISVEWMPYKTMFQSFNIDAYDFGEEELDKTLLPESEKKSRIISLWSWLSVACVAAVVTLVVLHPWNNSTSVPERSAVAQVETKKVVQEKDSIVDYKEVAKEVTKPSPSKEQDIVTKPMNDTVLLADNKTPTRKHHNHKSSQSVQSPAILEQEISTAELLETMDILSDIGSEDASITVSPTNKGFVVRTVSANGQSSSYLLQRCSNSNSIELTNQSINF